MTGTQPETQTGTQTPARTGTRTGAREKPAERFGVLTDEAVERSRRRLGVPQPQHNPRTTTR